jgi:hypothetical protein
MKEFKSVLAKAVIRACEKAGTLTYVGNLWAEALDHMSSDKVAMKRFPSDLAPTKILDLAYSEFKEASDPVSKRETLTFLAAAAIWTALDGIKKNTVAAHTPSMKQDD